MGIIITSIVHTTYSSSSSYDLELVDINLNIKSFDILNNISLQYNKSDILFLTGESGAGKSSLLKILAGYYRPSSGKIVWKKPELKIACVRQNTQLLMQETMMENLSLAFHPATHASQRQFDSELLELAKYFDLFDSLEVKISHLSGGSIQLVAILRALLSRADIVILDEPTKSLDEKMAIKVFELLSFYNNKKNMGMIWASHHRKLIKQFSGRMIHLEKGKIVYSGQACFI